MPSSKNKEERNSAAAPAPRGDGSLRWIAGLLLFFFALFALLATVFYYFDWKVDYSAVHGVPQPDPSLDGAFANPCGGLGARLADALVGRSFGLFGVLIPLLLAVLSLRIMRLRSLFLNRTMVIGVLALFLGSLTLGLIFGTRWSLFGSGLGGAWGIWGAEALKGAIGVVGTALVVVAGWILTGVYINRSFIGTVNHAGEAIADGGIKVGKAAIGLVTKTGEKAAPVETTPAADPRAKAQAQAVAEPPAAQPEPVVEVHAPASVGEQEWEESPFREVTLGEEEHPAPHAGCETAPPAGPRIEREDDDFALVDLSGGEPFPPAAFESEPATAAQEAGLEIVVIDHKEALVDEERIESDLYDPLRELPRYQRPPVQILEDHTVQVEVSDEEIYENKEQIRTTLQNFGISISKIKASTGPTVTLYEIVPAPGIKISKIKSLEDDIALSLKALGIRIIAPMPGKGTVGIEVPNKNKAVVSMYSAVKSLRFQESKAELPIVLGKTIMNETFVIDLAKLPHLLVAGATGQGKSVGLNAIITSLLYKKHPAELKFVMVDPKKVELSLYARLEKHFLAKMESEQEAILTDTQKVVNTLNSLCMEMEARYELLRKGEVKKISEYNAKFIARRLNPQKGHRFLPYIVVVVDEFADMIMTAGREVETPITRLAQLARAVGIHLIIATQRPDVKVITGLIKANFPARIAFRVTSMIDSRTIIDQPGANQLIGRGDMLMSLNGEVTRVQCAFIDTPEIERIVQHISSQRGYPDAYALPDYVPESAETPSGGGEAMRLDPLFGEIARTLVSSGQASTSSIQRNFEVGFNRAGRIMTQLERAGIVGRQEGSKPRDVRIADLHTLEEILQRLGAN